MGKGQPHSPGAGTQHSGLTAAQPRRMPVSLLSFHPTQQEPIWGCSSLLQWGDGLKGVPPWGNARTEWGQGGRRGLGGCLPPAPSCSSYHSMLRDLGRKADSSAEPYSAFLLFSCFCFTDKRWANLARLLSDLGKGRGKELMSLKVPCAGGCKGQGAPKRAAQQHRSTAAEAERCFGSSVSPTGLQQWHKAEPLPGTGAATLCQGRRCCSLGC